MLRLILLGFVSLTACNLVALISEQTIKMQINSPVLEHVDLGIWYPTMVTLTVHESDAAGNAWRSSLASFKIVGNRLVGVAQMQLPIGVHTIEVNLSTNEANAITTVATARRSITVSTANSIAIELKPKVDAIHLNLLSPAKANSNAKLSLQAMLGQQKWSDPYFVELSGATFTRDGENIGFSLAANPVDIRAIYDGITTSQTVQPQTAIQNTK